MPSKDKGSNSTTKSRLVEKIKTYNQNDFKIKLLTKKNAPIKEELKQLVETKGYQTPNGSKRLEVSDEFELVNTVRTTAKLVPEAVSLIEKHLSEHKLIETVKVVREDKLQQLIEDGVISKRLANRLYELSETFAFSVKEL